PTNPPRSGTTVTFYENTTPDCAESSRSCSSFCSNPPEDWPESGRDQGPRLTFRTGSERFVRFWTSLSTVRDREAPGSNPGPPTISYSESAITEVVGVSYGGDADYKFRGTELGTRVLLIAPTAWQAAPYGAPVQRFSCRL